MEEMSTTGIARLIEWLRSRTYRFGDCGVPGVHYKEVALKGG